MKTPLAFLLLTLVSVSLHAAAGDRARPETTLLTAPATAQIIAAVRAADDERLAATKSGERARLDAIFSDELIYAHSSGMVDNKASYMDSLVSKRTVYESFDYKQRDFKIAGPGVVIMTGRVFIKSTNTGGRSDNDLNFLAVWREENGKWRFYAWQSSKMPPPTPPAAK
ncbi:MAG: nuclear transport factor 2 family protein [Opitutaceae bacterium]